MHDAYLLMIGALLVLGVLCTILLQIWLNKLVYKSLTSCSGCTTHAEPKKTTPYTACVAATSAGVSHGGVVYITPEHEANIAEQEGF